MENLTKIFRSAKGEETAAVQNVNLTVEDGEFLVLVGPSGAGKSTTLRMIAGLEEISGGTVSLDVRVVNDVPPKDRDLAMVFQNPVLYPHMTVGENLAFGLKLRKIPRLEIERRVREVAELLGLAPYLDREPRALSGGERQRVALGRALARQPKVLLLDEPLSNLDAPLRAQLRGELARLRTRRTTTMIYVTHDQTEAMTLGDRVAVMKDGAIQQVAAPLALHRAPANVFVAGFIGTPPMNFFPGRFAVAGAALLFVAAGAPENFTLRVEGEPSAALKKFAGQKVVLGLRPENVPGSPPGEPSADNLVAATVEFVEPQGAEIYLRLKAGAHSFTARMSADDCPEAGGKVSVAFDMRRAHFFDPVTQRAMAEPAESHVTRAN